MNKNNSQKSQSKKYLLFILIPAMFYLQSCALITSGKQVVPIQTEPNTASIYLDGIKVGNGNYVAILPRNNRKPIVEAKLEGYESVSLTLYKKVRTGYLVGNIVSLLIWPWGVPSIIVDAATGAWKKTERDEVKIILSKNPASSENK